MEQFVSKYIMYYFMIPLLIFGPIYYGNILLQHSVSTEGILQRKRLVMFYTCWLIRWHSYIKTV